MRRVMAVVGVLVGALGCGAATTIEKVDVDTYHITCRELPLGRCLSETVDNTCHEHAYFVARGISELNRRGTSESPDLATSSEAIVRCASGDNWSYQAKELMAPPARSSSAPVAAPKPPPAPAPPSPPPPSAPVCAPGSTQSCVGAGACSGGQACKADGSGYEPCDCGATEAPR